MSRFLPKDITRVISRIRDRLLEIGSSRLLSCECKLLFYRVIIRIIRIEIIINNLKYRKMSKKEQGSKGWLRGKSEMTSSEKESRIPESKRSSEKVYLDESAAGTKSHMAKFAEWLKSQASEKEYPGLMSQVFGENWNASDLTIEKMKSKYGGDYEREYLPTVGRFQEGGRVGQANIELLKKYEDQMRTSASQKGMKGEAFGFSGGYGKGKIRAGVSSDMDAKNEDALNNSGLLG